jgi:ferredoxin
MQRSRISKTRLGTLARCSQRLPCNDHVRSHTGSLRIAVTFSRAVALEGSAAESDEDEEEGVREGEAEVAEEAAEASVVSDSVGLADATAGVAVASEIGDVLVCDACGVCAAASPVIVAALDLFGEVSLLPPGVRRASFSRMVGFWKEGD